MGFVNIMAVNFRQFLSVRIRISVSKKPDICIWFHQQNQISR